MKRFQKEACEPSISLERLACFLPGSWRDRYGSGRLVVSLASLAKADFAKADCQARGAAPIVNISYLFQI